MGLRGAFEAMRKNVPKEPAERTSGVVADAVDEELIRAIEHHLLGLKRKIIEDFGKESYDEELAKLAQDPVYSGFSLDRPEYVVIRLMGRVSISIGRRLGEIYDRIPRFLAAARFDISPNQVAEKINGLELDIALRYEHLNTADREHVAETLTDIGADGRETGVAIEIRYNFNPNDSARLRKDVDLARYVREAGLFPVYLIYSTISPREEAIARLARAGWNFVEGQAAINLTNRLLGTDFLAALRRHDVGQFIDQEVESIMECVFGSYAFSQVRL